MKMTYSEFTQKYIELHDEMKGVEIEIAELGLSGEIISEKLTEELGTLIGQIVKMQLQGEAYFGASPEQMYKDGWNFWMKEDMELREKRYGGK